jgi:hypothetical protein
MNIIAHRRNQISELRDTPRHLGVEVDIRSEGARLIINHDPFAAGGDFLEWIAEYEHGTLILNVKEEGLEWRLIKIMVDHGIHDYFFLDQSFPFLLKTINLGERRCAVRVSEFESIDTALSLSGRIDWVWVDCFGKFPLNAEDANLLKSAGFKLCIVSPELQGRIAPSEVNEMRALIQGRGIEIDAVCTKTPHLWE